MDINCVNPCIRGIQYLVGIWLLFCSSVSVQLQHHNNMLDKECLKVDANIR